jgi:lipopolysaccharide/colanic/teichoic acid biosynthesis glycosyltransferase
MSITSPQASDLLPGATSGATRFVLRSSNWDSPMRVFLKRVLDVAISAFLLAILSPIFVILIILVRLTSSGPAFYKWKVVGKNGAPFTGYKFRSMVADADRLKDSLETHNEMTGPVFKMTHDPRVTPVGAWMRCYSLDELPQLYSVLKGEMSLVGPRPPLETEYARFSAYQRQKLDVTPGMTCLWQINGRNEVSNFEDWVALDLEYIRRWSLWLDCRILMRTAWVVIAGSGR